MSVSYYWLCFWTAAAQTEPCFFLYRCHSMQLNNQYWGHALTEFACTRYNGARFVKCIHVTVFAKFLTLFSNTTALARLLLLALANAIQHKKPFNTTNQIYLLTYTSLFSIKSNVLKLDTVKKVYIVNKGLFLGVFSLPWFVYVDGYHNVIYHPLCWDILLLKVLVGY